MNMVLTAERRDLLRHALSGQRKALSGAEVQRLSADIQARVLVLACYQSAAAIAVYSPIDNEVETATLVDHALETGKHVFLPRWLGQEFGFAQLNSRAEVVKGRFGILEPAGPLVRADVAPGGLLVFVPGVGFDCRGHRLGRGGGNYDRMLSRHRAGVLAIGLAYEIQIAESVPAESWDYAMHFIITEKRTIDCRANRNLARIGSTGN
jgi:5-formyltetrahydrofolate cyclo-ligase